MYKKAWCTCKIVLFIKTVAFLERTIRKFYGGRGVGNFQAAGIFFVINFLVWISFRSYHEYFLGLIGLHKLVFHLIFPCSKIFFVLRPPPPLPPVINFLTVRPFDVRVAVAVIGSSTIRHHRVQSPREESQKKRFVRFVNSQVCVLYVFSYLQLWESNRPDFLICNFYVTCSGSQSNDQVMNEVALGIWCLLGCFKTEFYLRGLVLWAEAKTKTVVFLDFVHVGVL